MNGKVAVCGGLTLGFLLAGCSSDDDDATDFETDTGVLDARPSTQDADTTNPADMGSTGQPDFGDSSDAGEQRADFGSEGFLQPFNTVPVNIVVDDRANRSYTMADGLAWKGTFDYNPRDRLLSFDPTSNPPFPILYDDGAWNESGMGHEPAGAIAGDNIWGLTAFVRFPQSRLDFEYEVIRGSQMGSDGPSIWTGPLGRFTVNVGSRAPIDVVGLVVPAWGEVDFRIELDTSFMEASFRANFNPSRDSVQISSVRWDGTYLPMLDTGTNGDRNATDGIYTFQLSPNVGPGTPFPHTGRLASGDFATFRLRVAGRDYVGTVSGLAGMVPLTEGVSADVQTGGSGPWTRTPITRTGPDNETAIQAP